MGFIVYLTDDNGIQRFYTGRAGRYFLSASKGEAFAYSTMRGALNKAYALHKMLGRTVSATAA